MTIKQAFDEVNATDEQKKNGLDRLLQSDKKRSFIPQIKRYAAAAAAARMLHKSCWRWGIRASTTSAASSIGPTSL